MKKMKKRLSSLGLCLMILVASGTFGSAELIAHAAKDVTPSTKEYEVELYQTGIYLGNEKGINVSGGEAVYMTYTVSSVDVDTTTQSGLIATTDNTGTYPYLDGIMQFNNLQSLLMKPGYTYFLKFEITEFGFEYVAVYSNGEDEGYETGFMNTVGEIKDNMQYCGIWLTGGDLVAKLTHVRCYDKKGNDLGLVVTGGTVIDPTFKSNASVEHSYEFKLNKHSCIALSNAKYSRAKEIYLEYEVKNVTSTLGQNGFIMSNSPTALYPYDGNAGFMQFRNYYDESGGELTIPGAKYLIRFTRNENDFTVTARYTLNGKNYYLLFPNPVGTYNAKYGYCSVWFGAGELTAEFCNVRSYDSEGNNLGIQLNQSDVEIVHYGGWEDYTACEAMYYCAENETLIGLKADQSIQVQQLGDGVTRESTYRIDGSELTATLNKKKEKFEYSYIYMTDESGHQYNRLKEYTVKFVTGTEDITKTASMENSYKIETPENPTMKGNTFKGWYLGDGTEYKASSITTESKTVYAKWVDGDGNEYLSVSADIETPKKDMMPAIVISSCTLIVLCTAVGILVVVKKGGKKLETK